MFSNCDHTENDKRQNWQYWLYHCLSCRLSFTTLVWSWVSTVLTRVSTLWLRLSSAKCSRGRIFNTFEKHHSHFWLWQLKKIYICLLYSKLYSILVFSVPLFFPLVDCIEPKCWTEGNLKDIIFYNFIIVLKTGILFHGSNYNRRNYIF